MIPAGYMLKHTACPEGFNGLEAIHSVSGCIGELFDAEYFTHWRHNGFWFYDDPDILREIAASGGAEKDGLTLFYYEVHEDAYDAATGGWTRIAAPEPVPKIRAPIEPRLQGYDIVSFYAGNMPECSPLTCNGLRSSVPVTRGGLFATFEEAKAALEAGLFRNAEPGPYRVFAVHTCTG